MFWWWYAGAFHAGRANTRRLQDASESCTGHCLLVKFRKKTLWFATE